MAPRRRNPEGAWVLRAIAALLLLDDPHRDRLRRRALRSPRNTHARDRLYFHHGLLCLLMAAWTAPLAAQAPGSLSGRVTDPQDAAVPGAVVVLYARDGAARFVAVADAQGNYRFERLAAGEYLVEGQASGFAPAAAA